MNRKTILYLGSLDLPDGNAAANRAWVIGKMLRDCGYEMVFIGAYRDFGIYAPILKTKRKIDDFTSYINPRRDFIVSVRSIVRVVEAIGRESLAAIIAVNYPAFPLNTLRQYCMKNEIPLVADCTEWYAANQGNPFYRAFKWLDIQYRMRFVHRQIRHVICISRFLESYYKRHGCDVFYLPSIVDKHDPKWAVAPFERNDDTRRFVYAGTSIINDHLEYVLDAFYKIMQRGFVFEFHIFGMTKEYFLAHISGYREKLNQLENNVLFHGKIPHTEVIQFIKASDFTVFIRERNRVTEAGFPTKFVESLACGIPPITTRTSDIADYLENEKNGLLIENCDPSAIEATLLHAVGMDKQQLDQMKEKSRLSEQIDYRYHLPLICQYISHLSYSY